MSPRASAALRDPFLAALGDAGREAARSLTALDQVLGQLVQTATAAWPTVRVDLGAFVGHMARALDTSRSLPDGLSRVRAADLYIAFAAAHEVPEAIRAIEQVHRPAMWAAVRRIKGADAHEDLMQVARNHLFVGRPGQGPAIARYDGRGSLAAWLRVTTFNIVAKAARGKRLPLASLDEQSPEIQPDALDPELAFLKQAYRSAFKDAFVAALESLGDRQRTLLRQSVVHQLSVRRIGQMYGVHHATAARWVADAREELLTATRTRLVARLGVEDAELRSILALVRSQLDLSISRVLT